jgi:hypothetical protein
MARRSGTLEPHADDDGERGDDAAGDRPQLLIDRITNGTTKLKTTIVQNSGANEPRCVTRNTSRSADALP